MLDRQAVVGDRPAPPLPATSCRSRARLVPLELPAPTTWTLVAVATAACDVGDDLRRRLLADAVVARAARAAAAGEEQAGSRATAASQRAGTNRIAPMLAAFARRFSSRTGRIGLACDASGIHHLGVAVADLDEAVETYRRLFGAELELRETIDEQGVETALLRVGDGRIELLASLDARDARSAGSSSGAGPGMHHVAFEVDDVGRELERLAADGCRADRRRSPGAGLLGLRDRLRPPARHGRGARGAGRAWLRASGSGSRSPFEAASR